LGIEPQASYIITVRNPIMPSPEQAAPEPKEKYQFSSAEEEKIFRGKRFASADPVELLDYAGVGFELVSASGDLQAEFDLELNAEREDIRSAELFRELRLEQSKPPVAPLFREKGK
jgi:hypothetical protein